MSDYHNLCNSFNRIVQAFDNIVDALIESEDFTNISIVEQDLALRGERVSYIWNNE